MRTAFTGVTDYSCLAYIRTLCAGHRFLMSSKYNDNLHARQIKLFIGVVIFTVQIRNVLVWHSRLCVITRLTTYNLLLSTPLSRFFSDNSKKNKIKLQQKNFVKSYIAK